ncbi:MAG: acyl-phosphate glycerol 3-phosphate acyltransferase [Thermobacillus sp. ZCTH02-B1]|uniref:glycerol-3-phosphate 1-O-acyltransferase PlsY n=1 Tax=Thermobacillus sp. ZCTH02-B1 TaxID=1858795 RepID=UPI000B5683CC|nr:glycerol-3-phosphate 1-O-acyltransferase PlsY [Thermobacillus sp. ZCTH02-B1]OUM96800.1 MAG: acyl-phosphate glycerol 3-phosphate acyltransferase [Thermobacillus sp. ZCTH02-B1]
MLASIIAVAASYLLGSVSFSILIARWVKGIDIRKYGSGNAGATNTLRVLGKGPAAVVFLLDVGKGIAAVLLGKWLGDGQPWVPILCGAAAITGHNWPIWFRFKGGKGIATTIGVMATIAFWPALIAGVIAIAAVALTRYVSLGSLIFVTLLPVFILVLSMPRELFWASLLIWAYAFIRHRTNIVKLVRGQEHKLGTGKGVQHGK